MVRGSYNLVGRDEGEGGSVVGWATVDPGSLRFATFVSPRTSQRVSGLCVQLSGESRESWINKAGRWERMQGWMKQAYLQKLDAESSNGVDDVGELPDQTGTVDSL